MAPPPKRKKADLALLMEAEPEETDPLEEGFEDEELDDLGEEVPFEEEEADPLDPLADPLAAESSIDPEQADLCVTLGFTDPEQQQALFDLIDLRTALKAPKTDMGMESELPPLPESTY